MRYLYLVFIFIVFLTINCLASNFDYDTEENQIRNKSKENEVIVYFKNGEKIKSETIEGEKHSVSYSPNKVLNEAKELNADEVVFIHNHPGQSTNISEGDFNSKELTENKFDKEDIRTEYVVVTRNNERRY